MCLSAAPQLIYLTGNDEKFRVAELVFADTNLHLVQQPLSTPELQSTSVQEIVLHSAQWAKTKLEQPFFLTDAAFQITALNGFPGPFVKYVNRWFAVDDYLRLMARRENRQVTIEDCLAYCPPGREPIIFSGSYPGTLAEQPGRTAGTPIDQIFIPQGLTCPLSEISPAERLQYWSRVGVWRQLKAFLNGSASTND